MDAIVFLSPCCEKQKSSSTSGIMLQCHEVLHCAIERCCHYLGTLSWCLHFENLDLLSTLQGDKIWRPRIHNIQLLLRPITFNDIKKPLKTNKTSFPKDYHETLNNHRKCFKAIQIRRYMSLLPITFPCLYIYDHMNNLICLARVKLLPPSIMNPARNTARLLKIECI